MTEIAKIDQELDRGWPPSLISNGGVPLDDLFLFVDPVAIKKMIEEEGLSNEEAIS